MNRAAHHFLPDCDGRCQTCQKPSAAHTWNPTCPYCERVLNAAAGMCFKCGERFT